MKPVDLHMHTTASDGDHSPKELVDLAIKNGLKVIGITDHDTMSGLEEAIRYSKDKEIKVVPGVEINCDEDKLGIFEIHIVGLFIDYKNKELDNLMTKLKQYRVEQKKKIVGKLINLGYDISFEELRKKVGDSFGRPHIAKILIEKYPDKFSTVSQVFDELLGKDKKAYVKQEKCTIKEAIDAIRGAGGISIFAHPGLYLKDSETILKKFIEEGGEGIEANYPYNHVNSIPDEESESLNTRFKELAKKHNLLITGGSDYHGPSRPVELGEEGITEKEFEGLVQSI